MFPGHIHMNDYIQTYELLHTYSTRYLRVTMALTGTQSFLHARYAPMGHSTAARVQLIPRAQT
jgi:hypothetical protein